MIGQTQTCKQKNLQILLPNVYTYTILFWEPSFASRFPYKSQPAQLQSF